MRSEEFEKWYSEYTLVEQEEVASMWNGVRYWSYKHLSVLVAWSAWNASREAVFKESIKELKS